MIGRTIKHYRVEDVLGKGGMGIVYRARDTRLDRSVALKFLPSEFTSDPDRKRRFFQEARAAGAVNHPAIAQVYDVDEDDGSAFIVMEHVQGKTLRTLLRGSELDLLGAIEIGVQVAGGLARAHEAGIVHRDIKAENIMVTPDGHAKILDFGLAKLLEPPRPSGDSPSPAELSQLETLARTQAGMVLGTLRYMSPEQARGRPVDHRSDIFSLGVVLYEMVTGQVPFSGESPLDALHAIAFEETRPITAIRPSLPPSLERVIARCLRKKPEERYADAREMQSDLKTVKREVESGASQPLPLALRLRKAVVSIRDLKPSEWAWPVAIVGATVVVVVLARSAGKDLVGLLWGLVCSFGLPGLFVYRRFKNRRIRLMRQFCSKVQKMPEVRVVAFSGVQATVVVDKAVARTYIRVNALMESINQKSFFGEPFTVTVREDLTPEEVRTILTGPGVLYVREDVLGQRIDTRPAAG